MKKPIKSTIIVFVQDIIKGDKRVTTIILVQYREKSYCVESQKDFLSVKFQRDLDETNPQLVVS